MLTAIIDEMDQLLASGAKPLELLPHLRVLRSDVSALTARMKTAMSEFARVKASWDQTRSEVAKTSSRLAEAMHALVSFRLSRRGS